jgi:hypothetical protein
VATISKTVQEVRDQILDRLGAPSSTDWQAIVLEEMNNAVVFITGLHEWMGLRKKTTITTTDATGIVQLPADVDRVLSFHQPGEDVFITELTPMQLEETKEDENITTPKFFCLFYDQDTTTQAVHLEMEIFAKPSSGTSYTLWYAVHIDEFTTADLATVPKLPPQLWDLVRQKALLECLKKAEASKSDIINTERTFMMAVDAYKSREDMGTSKFPFIRQNAAVLNHYQTRMNR